MPKNLGTWIVLLPLLVTLSACQKKQSPAVVPAKTVVTAAPVDAKRLNDANRDAANWLTHGRTYSEQRFSPLKAINVQSVTGLKLAWYLDLAPGERGQASTPLIVDGVMFVTTSWSRVVALDAATGKVLWRYD